MALTLDHDNIGAFVYELFADTGRFPLSLLRLLKKHFGYAHALFFPRFSFGQAFPIDRPYAQEPFVESVSIDIPRAGLYRYFGGPHKDSIFWPEHLIPEQYACPVLLPQDIMPLEAYHKTPAYAELAHSGLRHQMLIQLNHDGMQLGAIALHRLQHESPFGPDDRALAETICPYITQAYKAYVEKAKLQAELNLAHRYYMGLGYGSFILDNTFMVLCHNTKAQEYCADIQAHYHKTRDPEGLIPVVMRGSSTVAVVQDFVTRNREPLWGIVDKPANLRYVGFEQCYVATIKSLSTEDVTGKMNIYYAVTMLAQPAEVVDLQACLRYGLTNREIQVASFILQGMTNKQISEQMFISDHTTKTHISKIFTKTDARKRTELIHKLSRLAPE
ncbi:MAG: helix-turn-helix transcriptional regulator [Ruminococcaceae bacterium]|nr:helix-turn-helix transcriptional regulator [Oscillospiraceae bacterium]